METREISDSARFTLRSPQYELPTGFVPLRLFSELELAHIVVDRPVAILGRHSAVELCFMFAEVSRRHCRFSYRDGVWRVVDLDSLNGVYLNGERVIEATLYAGDRLRMGCVHLLVESATPLRAADEKLRQIADALPQKPLAA